MRDDLIESGAEPLEFVGGFSRTYSHVEVASAMRDVLRIPDGWAEDISTWIAALRFLRSKLDAAGVLVVFNGVVGNSTSRKLDTDEFQGFALVDEYAPLIFVNNADLHCGQDVHTRYTNWRMSLWVSRACPTLRGCNHPTMIRSDSAIRLQRSFLYPSPVFAICGTLLAVTPWRLQVFHSSRLHANSR